MRRIVIASLWAAWAVSPALATGDHVQALAAFVKSNDGNAGWDIYVATPSGVVRRVTHDGARKRNIALSFDGSRIAYSTDVGNHVARGRVVVVDIDGKTFADQLIEPEVTGIGYPGLRWVDGITWLGTDNLHLAVSGSINPSQSVTYLLNCPDASGKYAPSPLAAPHPVKAADGYEPPSLNEGRTAAIETDNILDDGGALAFSPDGHHYASVAGIPHFGLNQPQFLRPKLSIDWSEFEPLDVPAWIVSPLAWSADSRRITFVAVELGTHPQARLVDASIPSILHEGTKLDFHTYQLPEGPEAPKNATWNVFWEAGDLYVHQGDAADRDDPKMILRAWKFVGGNFAHPAIVPPSQAADPYYSALAAEVTLFGPVIGTDKVPVDAASIVCRGHGCGVLDALDRNNLQPLGAILLPDADQ